MNSARRILISLACACQLALVAACSVGPDRPAALAPAFYPRDHDYEESALLIADYLLNQQNPDGAIPDCPDCGVANEDSCMEYALMGLAAAYRYAGDARYLDGLESGIRWLAAREEMIDPVWRGSWRYAFQSDPPYDPIAISPGGTVVDVRGVDATSALFVYLLYLHAGLSGSDGLKDEFETEGRAALDFALDNNMSPEGFAYSSWQKSEGSPDWVLWKYRYAADQADVYLGLRAGCLLWGETGYCDAAQNLLNDVPSAFFNTAEGRYCIGLEEDGSMDGEMRSFDAIFPQGYLPWVWGSGAANDAAHQWLEDRVLPGGGVRCYPGDRRYSLSAAILGLSAVSLGRPAPGASYAWLIDRAVDRADGGVRDTASPISEKFSNVAGFSVMSLLGFPPFIE